MYKNTTDGSNDNEAVKIANAFKPFWKKWIKEWGRSCVRSKKMTVTTAPSILTGLIGVTDAFSDTECMIPFQMDVCNASVGDTVWVRWMYDNQQTMYAESMGDLSVPTAKQTVIQSGTESATTVTAESSTTIDVIFAKAFSTVPNVVACLTSSQTTGTALCSVRVWNVTTTGFTIGLQNGFTSDRVLGATWIAVGT